EDGDICRRGGRRASTGAAVRVGAVARTRRQRHEYERDEWEQDRGSPSRHSISSTMTLVALTAAVACIPGLRPSSSTASRVIIATMRCGPERISTLAATAPFFTAVITPGKGFRALIVVGCGLPRRSLRILATSAAGTSRWPPDVRLVFSF